AGRLERPLPQSTTNSYGYFLVCPEGTEERAKVAAFRAWVLSEAERDGHRPPAEAAVSA
ncbi:MAG: LysR family transcriptional regulator, partial [Gammaproteobacteria bacterium]|nr:LysR family transcriptional regulator [Gammaproteobacteria bacterium]NIY31786.1 LysR family transcriptional regulator [Gammaproteobacteria bacterium]